MDEIFLLIETNQETFLGKGYIQPETIQETILGKEDNQHEIPFSDGKHSRNLFR